MPQDPKKYIEVNIPDLIRKATDKSGVPIYANHAQFSIGANEINIDLYQLGNNPIQLGKPQAIFVQRIVIPFSLVKGFVSALANIVKRFERDTGITIENTRPKDSEDILDVWK